MEHFPDTHVVEGFIDLGDNKCAESHRSKHKHVQLQTSIFGENVYHATVNH
jgi:hypothetical protein